MSIQNLPTALQPIIQQGFLERAFQEALQSQLGFRAVADREKFPNKIGETITKTRRGLKAPVETALDPTTNTNLDNGLTPSSWTVEQFTLSISQYGDTQDLNTVTDNVQIVKSFLENAEVNGTQARQSLDRLARNALFGAYLGGNTRVRTTLGAAGTTVAVDDIRGFQYVFSNGVFVPVSNGNPLTVVVGADAYSVVGVTADGSNVSTAPKGVSGTLTFSGNVTVSDGTAGNAVVSSVAPAVFRPNSRATTAAIQSGDKLLMSTVLASVARHRDNNVPTIDGRYNVYLDNQQMLGLFSDADFKYLYRGAYGSKEYREGEVIELLGARFVPTNEAPQQTLNGLPIHRALVCGQGALIEGDFAGMGDSDTETPNSIKQMIDGVCHVTRPPLDRFGQIIAQSWYWIGGFAVPTDVTANPTIIPTASNSYFKRALVIESA